MCLCRHLCLLWPLLLCLTGCYQRPAPQPILIGHLAPLSGPARVQGEHAQKGIELAVDEANEESNRIAGQPVNVLHADIVAQGDAIQNQTVRLVTINHITALLCGPDAAGLERIGRAAQPYNLPVVSAATLSETGGNDYVFTTAAPPAYQGQVLARFAAETIKPASVIVLSDSRSSTGTSLATAFIREAARGKAGAVDQWTYQAEADFPELIKRVKKAQPKAILVAGAAADLARLRAQLHEAAPQAPLLFGAEEGSVPTLTMDENAPGKAYLASVFATEGLTTAGQELAGRYREKFGQDLDVHASLAYDDARVLFEAMRRAHGSAGQPVRKELLALENFETLTGPLTFDRDHRANRPLFVLQLEGSHAKMIKRYDPESN